MRTNTERFLPGIHIGNKLQQMATNVETKIVRNLSRVDRATMNNMYHVSEYCRPIQISMLMSEGKWEVNCNYMNK